MRYLFILLLITGCASKLEIQGFEHYVALFQKEMNQRMQTDRKIDNLVIRFGDTSWFSPSTIGLCEYGGRTPIITIDPDFWAISSESIRSALIFHEMGHCVLGQKHRDNVPSVMEPNLISNFLQAYEYYVDELFQFQINRWAPFKRFELHNHEHGHGDCMSFTDKDGVTFSGISRD